MIVDDSDIVRAQMKKFIEVKDQTCLEAEDGYEALKVLEANKDVCLIFCDVNMPNMDGITLCKLLSENKELSHIPIIMTTTESSPKLKAKAREFGVKGWLTKPFEKERVQETIDLILIKKMT